MEGNLANEEEEEEFDPSTFDPDTFVLPVSFFFSSSFCVSLP